jgi:alpha-galactosidase
MPACHLQLEVWMKPLAGGGKAVGLFNRLDSPAEVSVRFRDIEVGPTAAVRDLWSRKDAGGFQEKFRAEVPIHGVVMFKIR